MLSRRVTKILAELYNEVFKGSYRSKVNKGGYVSYEYNYKFEIDSFHDFLYERDYPEWFLLAITSIKQFDKRSATEFIMGLNTGAFLFGLKVNPNDSRYKFMKEEGKELLNKLAQDILIFVSSDDNSSHSTNEVELRDTLLHQLELDGFIFRDNVLYFAESNILDVEEETGIIHRYIKELKLNNENIIFHHLELIEKDYLDRKWDDSIGNSRKFLECVLQEIADKHSITAKGLALPTNIKEWAGKVRQYFETEKLFSEQEIKALREIYGLMSETGNHPYIAEKDQAILMRNLSLTLAQFALLRYLGWTKKT